MWVEKGIISILEVSYTYTLCDFINNKDIISSQFWKLDTQIQGNIRVGFQDLFSGL